jgi:3'-5' exoribonuclease
MKEIYIADLARFEENRSFDSVYLVLSKQQRTTRTAKPYLSLILGDNTGQIEARVWDIAADSIATDFAKGDAVKIRGTASKFEGVLQLKVERLKRLSPLEYDRTDLLPATTYNIDELWRSLESAVARFTDSDLQRLVSTVLADPAVRSALREAPAAKQLHHAFLGGLLEHVVSLIGLAEKVVPHYPLLMQDLVITGVILHDIGKIHELAWSTGFEYTLEGTLLGHIQIGASMVERAIDSLPGFPPRLKTLVLHTILSHHGKLEFGSPKQTLATEFQKAARQGKGASEMTDRIWALDQRTMLNSRAWLAEEPD